MRRLWFAFRGSRNPAEAREGLVTQFTLSVLQAQAILDMQLQRLTGLERQKILDELADLLKLIEQLRAILSSDKLLMQIIIDELREVQRRFGDERRTEIIAAEGEFRIEDFPADQTVRIYAWHPLFFETFLNVRVERGEEKRVELVLTPKPPPESSLSAVRASVNCSSANWNWLR